MMPTSAPSKSTTGSSDSLNNNSSSSYRVMAMGARGDNLGEGNSRNHGVVVLYGGRPMLEAVVAASSALKAEEARQCPLLLSFEWPQEHDLHRILAGDNSAPEATPRQRKTQTEPTAKKEVSCDPSKEKATSSSAAVVVRTVLREGLRDLGRRVVVQNAEVSESRVAFWRSQLILYIYSSIGHHNALLESYRVGWTRCVDVRNIFCFR